MKVLNLFQYVSSQNYQKIYLHFIFDYTIFVIYFVPFVVYNGLNNFLDLYLQTSTLKKIMKMIDQILVLSFLIHY